MKLVLPMYNVHPYFLSKIWAKNLCIIPGKIPVIVHNNIQPSRKHQPDTGAGA